MKYLSIEFKIILSRMMVRLKDVTNALEQGDSLMNKGLNNSFLNCNRWFFF